MVFRMVWTILAATKRVPGLFLATQEVSCVENMLDALVVSAEPTLGATLPQTVACLTIKHEKDLCCLAMRRFPSKAKISLCWFSVCLHWQEERCRAVAWNVQTLTLAVLSISMAVKFNGPFEHHLGGDT